MASRWVSKALSWRRTLQAIRASLLAKATASLFLCNRSDAVFSHAPKLVSGPAVRAHQEHLRRLDQQRAQVLAAPLGDAAEDRPAAGAVLSGHKAEPGAKIAPALKSLSRADRGDKTGRNQRPDARHAHQPQARGLDAADFFDVAGDSLDALVQPAPVSIKTEDQLSRSWRNLVLPVLQYREE